MRRVFAKALAIYCIALCISIVLFFLSSSLACSLVAFGALVVYASLQPFFLVMNWMVKRTRWYRAKVGDGAKFLGNIPLHLDICNLGSNSGKYAFDYSATGLRGVNWALGPQTLSYDFRVLQNYFSYLREGATVLIPLCPFSGCIKDFDDDSYNTKYYSFLHPILINNYSEARHKKVRKFVNSPFLVSPIKSVYAIVFDIKVKDNTILSPAEMEADADTYVANWKEQFSIDDLGQPVSERNAECIRYNVDLLNRMVAFCVERSLRAVIVLPPTTKALSSRLPVKFRERYIYSMIKGLDGDSVRFLDYLEDERFEADELFTNSYFLNQKGRALFTAQVCADLDLV